MKTIELKNERSAKNSAMRDLLEIANGENRNLSEEEQKRFDTIEKEVNDLNKRIENAEKLEQLKREEATKKVEKRNEIKQTEEQKIKKRYSFAEAINQQGQRHLTGLVAEMHQEAEKEARESGLTLSGLGVPSMFLDAKKEERDMVVGTTTAGGHFVQTSVGPTIEALRPRLQTQALGARVMTGLVGNTTLPRHNGVTSAAWEGEVDANAESTAQLFSTSNIDSIHAKAKAGTPNIEYFIAG